MPRERLSNAAMVHQPSKGLHCARFLHHDVLPMMNSPRQRTMTLAIYMYNLATRSHQPLEMGQRTHNYNIYALPQDGHHLCLLLPDNYCSRVLQQPEMNNCC